MKMKNVLFTAMAIMMVVMTANAQLGVRAGVNFANVSQTDNTIETKSNLRFHFGASYEIDINNQFAVRPGALFNLKGSKVNDPSGGDDVTLNANYIEIPLDIIVRFGSAENNRLGVFAGPYFGFLNSISFDGDDASDFFKNSDFGFNAGLMYDFAPLNAGIYYSNGLSNISESPFGDESIKNRAISAYIMYMF